MSAKRTLDFENTSTPATAATPSKKIKISSASNLSDPEATSPKSTQPLSPSKIVTAATRVDVCALLTGLSPMRKKHFIGELVDEHKSMRFVGFDPAQRMRLDTFNDNTTPVLLKNCDIQLNQYSKKLEVVIKGYTNITASPQKFQIEDPKKIGTTTITLNQLTDMEEFAKVNVHVKVIDVNPTQIVNGGKRKQEVVLSDQTGTATLTLWESDIDSLKMSKSYSITKLVVRTFRDNHFLSLPITGGTINETEDLEEVSDAVTGDIEPTLHNANICGVKQLQTYSLCLTCPGTVIESNNSGMGTCGKCQMTQKMSCCKNKLMAKFLVNGYPEEDSAEQTFSTVVAYGDILKLITETDKIDMRALLDAKPFTLNNGYYVVTSISRS